MQVQERPRHDTRDVSGALARSCTCVRRIWRASRPLWWRITRGSRRSARGRSSGTGRRCTGGGCSSPTYRARTWRRGRGGCWGPRTGRTAACGRCSISAGRGPGTTTPSWRSTSVSSMRRWARPMACSSSTGATCRSRGRTRRGWPVNGAGPRARRIIAKPASSWATPAAKGRPCATGGSIGRRPGSPRRTRSAGRPALSPRTRPSRPRTRARGTWWSGRCGGGRGARGATCDEGFGDDPAFLARLDAFDLCYLAAAPGATQVGPLHDPATGQERARPQAWAPPQTASRKGPAWAGAGASRQPAQAARRRHRRRAPGGGVAALPHLRRKQRAAGGRLCRRARHHNARPPTGAGGLGGVAPDSGGAG